jgi:hypothetical protein
MDAILAKSRMAFHPNRTPCTKIVTSIMQGGTGFYPKKGNLGEQSSPSVYNLGK